MRVLLIVDDCAEIARGLQRCLKHAFDAVHVAATAAEAERFLQAEQAPTHLLCDFFLGDDQPAGIELVRQWRSRYPEIVLAAIFSGSQLQELSAANGIDRVFRKPFDIEAIEGFLVDPPR